MSSLLEKAKMSLDEIIEGSKNTDPYRPTQYDGFKEAYEKFKRTLLSDVKREYSFLEADLNSCTHHHLAAGWGDYDEAEFFEAYIKELKGYREIISYQLEKVDSTPTESKSEKSELGDKIFVVHGHNDGILNLIRTTFGNENLCILMDQPNIGSTSIWEKLERNLSECNMAIVLMTFDEYSIPLKELSGQENEVNISRMKKRPRPNVIGEYFWLCEKYGKDRVIPVTDEGLDIPSDMLGTLETRIDDKHEWLGHLKREVEALRGR